MLEQTGFYELGMELERAENFWQVQFPPVDWETARETPGAKVLPFRAATASRQSEAGPHLLPSNLSVEDFPEAVRKAVNTPLLLLEEEPQ